MLSDMGWYENSPSYPERAPKVRLDILSLKGLCGMYVVLGVILC